LDAVRSLGLDIEQRQRLAPGIRELICANDAEARAIDDDPFVGVLLLSIKEAVLKAGGRCGAAGRSSPISKLFWGTAGSLRGCSRAP
jgi:hypothetical protein